MSTAAMLAQVVRNQRRSLVVALVVAVVAVGLGLSAGRGMVGVFAALGVGLGLLNALLTELSVVRMVGAGREVSRTQYGVSAMGRLLLISVVGLVLALVFWPNGIGALFGIAVFQLLWAVLTGLPLVRETRGGGRGV